MVPMELPSLYGWSFQITLLLKKTRRNLFPQFFYFRCRRSGIIFHDCFSGHHCLNDRTVIGNFTDHADIILLTILSYYGGVLRVNIAFINTDHSRNLKVPGYSQDSLQIMDAGKSWLRS